MKKESIMHRIGKYVPTPAIVIYVLALVSCGLYVSFILCPAFADAFNSSVSQLLRRVLAYISAPFPFSLAEALIMLSPILIFIILRAVFGYMDRHEHGFSRTMSSLVAAVLLLASVFTLNFAAGYRGSTLDRKLGLSVGNVSADDLERTAKYVAGRINELSDGIGFADECSFRSMTHSETVRAVHDSYDTLAAEYDFIGNFKAPVKRLAVSNLMTYTHISGVYTYFTGEANLNTNYPEFVNVYTIAHEMAHQRGIARENEANFIAYLVCIGSDSTYMQYSGYMNMFEYLISALYETRPEDASALYSELDSRPLRDLTYYSRFFEKYSDSAASNVSEVINDTFLQSQGTEGTRSYGMVVDLAVAYHASAGE